MHEEASDLRYVVVRLLRADERRRFDQALDEHHWLGHHLFGETMRYVAELPDGTWLALSGFGSAALSCRQRDAMVGWTDTQRYRRLRFVTNHQRYCVLPEGRRANLASYVLARTLRRLPADFEAHWGHPVVMVETFVDPARHVGTCYAASSFTLLGRTSGYGRRNGRWVHHGQPKLVFSRLLRKDAARLLRADFDHPCLVPGGLVLDLNRLSLQGDDGLLRRLGRLQDSRKPRGVRHDQQVLLAIATCATLAGARSVSSIGEYAADLPQEVLARLGARFHPAKRRYVAPHGRTIARALGRVEADELDQVVGAWLFDQVQRGLLAEEQLVLALDGKAMRGALRADGRAVHLNLPPRTGHPDPAEAGGGWTDDEGCEHSPVHRRVQEGCGGVVDVIGQVDQAGGEGIGDQ